MSMKFESLALRQQLRLRVFWKKKAIKGNWKTCVISSLIIGSHNFILILSDNCYLLLSTTALLSGQVGYFSVINELIGSDNQ